MTDSEATTSTKAALTVAILSSFIGPFMSSAVNVALPSIGAEFGLSAVTLGWINTAYLLAAASLLIPFGRLADIIGRKKIFTLGVLILTTASVLNATAPSGTAILIYRVFQGVGSAMVFSTGMPILISVVPPEQRGNALGWTVAAVYLGLSTGPFIGGLITGELGWRYIFWLNLPLGLFLVAVIVALLKGEWAEARGSRFDAIGSIILMVSLLAAMYGFSTLPGNLAIALLVTGVIGMAVFVRYELRLESPLLNIDLFRRNITFAFSNLAALINYAATFAISFLMSIYLQNAKGLTPQFAGIVLVSQPVMQAVVSPIAGRLSDRIEPRTLASLGMAINVVGLALLAFVNNNTTMTYIVSCLLMMGLGFGLFSSPNTNAIMSSVERRYYGIAGAMVATVRQIGMMFSMGIVMLIMALHLGSAKVTPESVGSYINSMHVAFAVFAVLCLGGVFASLARGRMRENHGR